MDYSCGLWLHLLHGWPTPPVEEVIPVNVAIVGLYPMYSIRGFF